MDLKQRNWPADWAAFTPQLKIYTIKVTFPHDPKRAFHQPIDNTHNNDAMTQEMLCNMTPTYDQSLSWW